MDPAHQHPRQMTLEDVLPDWTVEWHRSEVEMCTDHLVRQQRLVEDREFDLAVALAMACSHDQVSIVDLQAWSSKSAREVRRLVARAQRAVARGG